MKKILLALFVFFSGVVANANTLTFATEATYPPFESLDASGNMQGFDVDIIHALCDKMHAQCKLVNQAFDSLIPSLQLGKYDAIFGAMNITPAREKQVDFTNSYYANSASIVALKSKKLNQSLQSLSGKTIGVQSGTTLAQYLQEKYNSKVNVNTYASEQSAFLDLTSGRIDAVMGDTPLIVQWLKTQTNNDYEMVGAPIKDEKYFGKGYGIAVKKGNLALLSKLNQALSEIKKDGSYDKIVKKYFSTGT